MTVSTAPERAPERPGAPARTPLARRLLRDPVVVSGAVAVLLWVVAALYSPEFAGWGQIVTLLTVASFLGVIAIGQTLVIIAGGEGIDLSVGATATLSAIVASRYMDGSNEGIVVAVLLALGASCVVGVVNAVGVLVFRVPPLVMTLGMIAVVTGFIRLYTGGRPEGSAAPLLRTLVTGDTVAGIPGVLWLWLGLAVLVVWLLRRTSFGWRLYAVGGNPTTAYLSGVSPTAVRFSAYVLSSLFAGVGGMLLLGYAQNVYTSLGTDYMLNSVAAAVIGGTALVGGVGGYLGTVIGAILLTVLDSLLRIMQIGGGEWGDAPRQIIYGVVLIIVLTAYGRQKRLRQ
ncbi:ABC transporter permease [Streptomonospora nanhaiensis]|uniref:Autoinducer 2 import system permease protein LsrD n=1 Tax=Streptomonospora nanhaiensis TaxID=1323731 RepID=A0A853BII3_9ACTN|nr:ABC transporter permease [Streptomonospora nanhaiensis]MBV2365862.1 ABC transporter permease [Streptomonospora nanhaiensis]MBX9387595.1 ABC transporter permease [Streptomonospora nanhaiensis]NYI95239.1 ribose transport system permease protein [Streptomonospora nanhaiensis]